VNGASDDWPLGSCKSCSARGNETLVEEATLDNGTLVSVDGLYLIS
jgi:hypothetical protein